MAMAAAGNLQDRTQPYLPPKQPHTTQHRAPEGARNFTYAWANSQVTAFCDDVVGSPAALVGNSFGSLVALSVAAASPPAVTAVGMMNCAIGMNNKNVARVADGPTCAVRGFNPPAIKFVH